MPRAVHGSSSTMPMFPQVQLRGRASRVTGDVHLVDVTGDGRILYRVVAGRYQTAAAAGRAKTALTAAGLDSFVKRFGSSLN